MTLGRAILHIPHFLLDMIIYEFPRKILAGNPFSPLIVYASNKVCMMEDFDLILSADSFMLQSTAFCY